MSIWNCNSGNRQSARKLSPAARRGAAGDVLVPAPRLGGYLEARLNVHDAFPQDDRALIELPAQARLARRGLFQRAATAAPLVRVQSPSGRDVQASFEVRSGREGGRGGAGPLRASRAAAANSIWIEPPADGSPIPVRETKTGVRLEKWSPETPLGAGLRTQDVVLESARSLHARGGRYRCSRIRRGTARGRPRYQGQKSWWCSVSIPAGLP